MAGKLRYPTGVRPLLVEETARRRRIESRFVGVLEQGGFSEVVLPIIDYVDPYASLIERKAARQSYRFVDREGDLVGIRSDFTPMLARALAPALRAEELPLRLYYRGDVIRVEASRLGVNRELFQIGAEIVGDSSVQADLQMLRLAADMVRQFGAKPTVIYNDVSIAATLSALAPSVAEALTSKRISVVDRAALPAEAVALIEKLVAGVATLHDVRAFAPTAGAAERLARVAGELDAVEFALHLDDVDDAAGYYTGIRFRVYAGATRTRIAQGGRYDLLYRRFGTDAAAIGLTFTIDDIEEQPLSDWTAETTAAESSAGSSTDRSVCATPLIRLEKS